MKPTAMLMNLARGPIVDEEALYRALKEKKIAWAACDVFEKEPIDISEELFQFENYIVTPHVSAETYENCETTSIVTAEALISVFEGKEPDHRLV